MILKEVTIYIIGKKTVCIYIYRVIVAWNFLKYFIRIKITVQQHCMIYNHIFISFSYHSCLRIVTQVVSTFAVVVKVL